MVTPQPRGCTNFKLRQLLRRVSLVYDHAMAECGLKITQYSLLSHVDRLGPITQADLARAMGRSLCFGAHALGHADHAAGSRGILGIGPAGR